MANDLYLPQLTLCAIDTRTPDLALHSLRLSLRGIRYGEVLFFTSDPDGMQARALASEGIRVVDIPVLTSIEDYSVFVLKRLAPHVQTSHALLTQWDGFVRNPGAWRPEFLAYDYIGAPWPQFPVERSVGNGGFSLRSRKLLQALLSADIQVSHPEDVCICHQNRERLESAHQIEFAPPDVAATFSEERTPVDQASFGFHGAFHLLHVLNAKDLLAFIEQLPPNMSRTMEVKNLARALLHRGQENDLELAQILIQKRFAAGLRDSRQWRLWVLALWKRGLAFFTGHATAPHSSHQTRKK
jgi:hypothetical protein